jgi:phosphate transport system protein
LILNNEPQVKAFVDLPFMAETAGEMLKQALDAFNTEDAGMSRKVIKKDKEIDRAYDNVFGDLIELMIDNPSTTTGAAHLLFVAKHLERIGDYVKDICELNVYLTEAAFIKHSKK